MCAAAGAGPALGHQHSLLRLLPLPAHLQRDYLPRICLTRSFRPAPMPPTPPPRFFDSPPPAPRCRAWPLPRPAPSPRAALGLPSPLRDHPRRRCRRMPVRPIVLRASRARRCWASGWATKGRRRKAPKRCWRKSRTTCRSMARRPSAQPLAAPRRAAAAAAPARPHCRSPEPAHRPTHPT